MFFYSDDPVRDAERYYAWLDRQQEEYEEEYEEDEDDESP
jgi:hypothetical protein